MGLASRYGMLDMQIAPDAGTRGQSTEQSIEDEFASYTATISNSDTDVLAFWEVSQLPFESYTG